MTCVSFAIGDVVQPKWKGKAKRREVAWCSAHEGKYFVTTSSLIQGEIEYAINGCAWFYHRDWVLVERATEETLKIVRQLEESEAAEEDYDFEDIRDE